jgi:small subunit ribosomal protein S17
VSEPKAKSGASKAGAPKAAKAAPKGAASKASAPKASATKAAAAKPVQSAPAVAKAAPSAPKAPKPAPAASAAEAAAPEAGIRRSFKRTLIGRVKSDKMDKTIVVEVVRSKLDPVYKKYVRVRKSYQAHDEENTCKVGDRVEIIEHRPLSKMKRWKLLNLVERAVQE